MESNLLVSDLHGHAEAGTPSAADAAVALQALGSVSRLAVLRQLVRAGEDGLAVGRLQQRLGLPGSTLSHHLRALMAAGLVGQDRRGRTLICRARYDRIRALADFLVSECCADTAIPATRPVGATTGARVP